MNILNDFYKDLDLSDPLPEYPRPQMKRDSFTSLNGTWQYQITDDNEQPAPEAWKDITVPFALGSKLSGTEENLMPGKVLWYTRQFAYLPNALHTWLNFEAVDNECTVFLNGMEVGEHHGGYLPFSFDVSSSIKYQNYLLIRVEDDSEFSLYACGKQRTEHGGIWYTPTAGIWGSVWLEDIAEKGITDLKITPDFDQSSVAVDIAGNFDQALVTISDHGHVIASGITNDGHYEASLPDFHAWSVEDPFLYDLFVSTGEDVVQSYFGMRKFSAGHDAEGRLRFCLNNKPLFLHGLLDQGYTKDGMYTFPSDQGMMAELETIKDLGYNMLRKHMKIESRRWYAACDHLGLLVMQDMPCGGMPEYDMKKLGLFPTIGFTRKKDDKGENSTRSEESRRAYEAELDEMLDSLYNVTSLFAWCPFNEGWGQFEAGQITRRIQNYDRTRLVDSASGWFDQGEGDFASVHDYFFPLHVPKNDGRIFLLSEFGGYTYVEKGHSFPSKPYGYKQFDDKLYMNDALFELYDKMVIPNIAKGLSGCIYTQVSDVEDECNGIFTSDRCVLKIDQKRMKKLSARLMKEISK